MTENASDPGSAAPIPAPGEAAASGAPTDTYGRFFFDLPREPPGLPTWRPNRPKLRTCLKCREMLEGAEPQNRICAGCAKLAGGYSRDAEGIG